MNQEETFAYLAGYMDGDGCFNIRAQSVNQSVKYQPQIIVTSTDPSIMEFLKLHVGGNYSTLNNREKFPLHKTQYRFTLCGTKACINFAKQLLPFLVEKRDQAQILIKFCTSKNNITRDALIEKMHFIKKQKYIVQEKDIDYLKNLKLTKQATHWDYAYLAGFIDAECSMSLSRYRSKNRENWLYKTILSFTNTKLPCFVFLSKRFGGTFSFIESTNIAHRNQLIQRISSKSFADILPRIQPFIRAKKPICEELIKFNTLILKNGGCRHTQVFRETYLMNLIERDKIFNTIRQLNARGFISV